MKKTQREFIQRLRAWRERNQFSQRDAAEQMQISKRTLQNWEQGEAMPQGLALRHVEAIIDQSC